MANTTFNRYAATADATPTVALVTPAFNILPWASGTNVQLKSNSTVSPTMLPNGASGGTYNTSYYVEGNFSGQFARDNAIDLALQSLMMNTISTKVLTAGSTEKPVCYEKAFFETAGTFYRQARGCQHSKFDLKWDADNVIEFSSDFTGIGDARSATIITGATYVQPSNTVRLTGGDVTVTIGSLGTTQLKKGSLSISIPKKPQTICGSQFAVGVGTSGQRTVEYNFTFFKRDFAFETGLIGNTAQAVTLTMGAVNTGWKFESAKVIFESPQDEEDDSGQLISIKGVASYDTTALCDVKITQL